MDVRAKAHAIVGDSANMWHALEVLFEEHDNDDNGYTSAEVVISR